MYFFKFYKKDTKMTSIEVNLVGVFIDNSKHAQVFDLVVSLLPMKK